MNEPISLENMWRVVALGLFFALPYVTARTGLIKSWYILAPLPGLLSGSMVYGSLFWGLGFAAMAVVDRLPAKTLDARAARIFFVLMFFVVLGFVFTVWQPSWMKPRWVRWLEYEYGYCLDILIAEARLMGRWTWEAQVRTRAGMERWVRDVMAMHRKEIDERWELERDIRLSPKLDKAFAQRKFELQDYIVPNVPEHRRAQEEARLESVKEGLPMMNSSQWDLKVED